MKSAKTGNGRGNRRAMTKPIRKENQKTNDLEVEMEIFRTGDYGAKGSYSEDDLENIAADYAPTLLEAPLTFDHAQSGPAYGWVSRLRREGDRLWATFKDVPQTVLSMVKTGAYKRRSVELLRSAPHTSRPYLRAVSLLGAATPEVKGLRDVCFSSKEETCLVELPDQNPALAIAAAPDASANMPSPVVSTKPREMGPIAPLMDMFAQLRAEGYCLKEADAKSLQALFVSTSTLQSDTAQAVVFSQADTQAGIEFLERILKQSLLRASLGETPDAGDPGPAASRTALPTANFSDRVDPASYALHQATMQIMEAEAGLSYRDALLRVCR